MRGVRVGDQKRDDDGHALGPQTRRGLEFECSLLGDDEFDVDVIDDERKSAAAFRKRSMVQTRR